jgi:non-heme chloroperoxidase
VIERKGRGIMTRSYRGAGEAARQSATSRSDTSAEPVPVRLAISVCEGQRGTNSIPACIAGGADVAPYAGEGDEALGGERVAWMRASLPQRGRRLRGDGGGSILDAAVPPAVTAAAHCPGATVVVRAKHRDGRVEPQQEIPMSALVLRCTAALMILALAAPLAGQGVPVAGPRDSVRTVERVTGGGGVELAVYEAGAPGRPAIVLIHGFSLNVLTWQRQFESALVDEFHVVAYDLRGHGDSASPLGAGHYTDGDHWAEDLAAVIRSRNLDRPVVVGWSYGGYVISDYVRRFGDDALGGIVILASTTKNGTDQALPFFGDDMLAIFGDLLAPETARRLTATRALADLNLEPGSDGWLTAYGSAMMVTPEVRQAMLGRVLENDDVLARIRVPTLVVHGADDRIVLKTAAEHTARTVPGAQLLVYDGVGHAPHYQAADRFNRDLAEFVRRASAPRR